MYKRILLASDCSTESLVALREGALIARSLQASAHLLIVDPVTVGHRMADGLHPTPRGSDTAPELLRIGLDRLRRLGVDGTGQIAAGEPAQLIADHARNMKADLIVVGHRRRSLLKRWWSGPSGAYLVDLVDCSVLLARDTVSDAQFDALLTSAERPA